MHRLIVTDGFTLNPGDLSWDPFRQFGSLEVFERTTSDQILACCREASIIITNKTRLDATVIRQLTALQMIAVTATGYNVVDIDAARERNIPVCNVPGYGTHSVAQHTFALILELTNGVGRNAQTVAEGKWQASGDWCYTEKSITELHGKTLGVVGFGRIGSQVAHIASAFGMDVIYYNPSRKSEGLYRYAGLNDLFRHSDIVSLHCPLTDDNKQMVDRRRLELMKPSSYLINTSRGPLINEHDLADALRNGVLAGAALDVLSEEPPARGNVLIGLPNCIITPHNAWLSFEARSRIMNTTFSNIDAFVKGSSQNVIA